MSSMITKATKQLNYVSHSNTLSTIIVLFKRLSTFIEMVFTVFLYATYMSVLLFHYLSLCCLLLKYNTQTFIINESISEHWLLSFHVQVAKLKCDFCWMYFILVVYLKNYTIVTFPTNQRMLLPFSYSIVSHVLF